MSYTEPEEDKHRVVVVLLGHSLVIQIFNLWRNPPQFLQLPTHSLCIPQDAHVLNVWYDHNRRCFAALVRHDEFEVVPPGREAPIVNDYPLETEVVEMEKVFEQHMLQKMKEGKTDV